MLVGQALSDVIDMILTSYDAAKVGTLECGLGTRAGPLALTSSQRLCSQRDPPLSES